MKTNLYPAYVTTDADKAEMEFWCYIELTHWRTAMLAYDVVVTDEAKAAIADIVDAAYNQLQTAYKAALAYANHEAVKAARNDSAAA